MARHEQPRLSERDRLKLQREEAAMEGASLGKKGLHLTHERATDEELDQGAISLLLHDRGDGAEFATHLGLRARQEVRKFIDDDDELLASCCPVQHPKEVREVSKDGSHSEQWLKPLSEIIELRSRRCLSCHEHHGRLAMGETAEQPRLTAASSPVQRDGGSIARLPPLFQGRQFRGSINEFLGGGP